MEYILIFSNTHLALKCEKILNENNIKINILPAPTYLTNSCGISIGIQKENINNILDLIKKEKIIIRDIYDNVNKTILDVNKFDLY